MIRCISNFHLSATSRLQRKVIASLPRAVPTSSSCVGNIPPLVTQVGSTIHNNLFQNSGSVRYRSNRSRRGLYDGKDIRTGNNVSFSMKATKRKFRPNVFKKRVYSEVLDEMIRFHLTASTLRSIDKAGGLDNYLLTSKHVATSAEGKEAKRRILDKLSYLERQAKREKESSYSPSASVN